MPGVKEIFKSSPRVKMPTAFSANSPGFNLSTQLSADGRSLNSSLSRTGTRPQQEFDERFPRILGDIDTLRGTLTPGFSKLREAALSRVRERGNESIGNLRRNLARRRIQGSSFGEDALISAERQFAREEADVEAQSFLQELESNVALIREESAQVFNALQREFTEAGMSANFISTVGSIINSNQQFAEQARINQLAGQAQLAGKIVGFAADRAFPAKSSVKGLKQGTE